MKKNFAFGLVGLLFLGMGFTAQASGVEMVEPSFWREVSEFAFQSAEQPFGQTPSGIEIYGPLRSTSDRLKIQGSIATFELNGQTYTATVVNSESSDGGDLNDLVIRNAAGEIVAEQAQILAFSDVVLALAMGEERFTKVHDPSLDR